MLGGNLAMDEHPIQGRVVILSVAPCYGTGLSSGWVGFLWLVSDFTFTYLNWYDVVVLLQNWLAFDTLHRPLFSEHNDVNFQNRNLPSKNHNFAFCQVGWLPWHVPIFFLNTSRKYNYLYIKTWYFKVTCHFDIIKHVTVVFFVEWWYWIQVLLTLKDWKTSNEW